MTERIDDLLRGGDGNDWIVGDSASNQVPFKTESPHVVHGLRLIGRDASGVWWVDRSDGIQFVSETWGSWSSAINWTQVLAADFDGDGRDDVVGRASTGAWWVARSTGSAFVNTNWGLWSSAIAWQDIQIADLNGDGRSDLVGRTSNGAWWVAHWNGQAYVTEAWASWSNAYPWLDVLVGQFS